MRTYDDYARALNVHYAEADEPRVAPVRWRRHVVLAILTFTTMWLGHSWQFPVAFFAILFAHEMGHYVACRIYGVDASPPYFMPFFPLALLGFNFYPGTFGAFIRIRGRIPSRRALFDIGIAGPLAGFLVVLLLLPAAVAEIRPIPPHLVEEQGVFLSNPLLFQAVVPLMRGFSDSVPYEAGPIFLAVWWGCLATMLNLLPVGQLDGGHVAYAVFGRRYNRLALALLLGLWLFVIFNRGALLLMALLVTAVGPRHPPVGQEREGIGWKRRLLALHGLVTFVLCLNPLRFGTEPPPQPRPRPGPKHLEHFVEHQRPALPPLPPAGSAS